MQDKTIILVIFTVCVILIASMITFIAWILFAYQKKQNAFQQQLMTIKDSYEKELLKSQLEIQEQTFQYISQEIHDNVGQFISLAKLHLNTIDLDQKEISRQKIENSTELLTKALDDLRDLSKSLSSDFIKNIGLEKTIEMQISQLKKTANYEIDFTISGTHVFIEEQREIILFRIFQEAVNNILRHARAKKILVSLQFLEEHLCLLIKDDGSGFELQQQRTQNGGGLNIMKKRAAIIRAKIIIESASGSGTSVSIQLPFKAS